MPARQDLRSICVLGSGPIVIGQAAEFDYSGTQAVNVLKSEGYRVSLINSNPATIMTDPELADATYIESMDLDTVEKILRKERPDAILPTVGGQTALNLAMALDASGLLQELSIELIGASAEAIDRAENRQKFKEAMGEIGLDTLKSRICHSLSEAKEIAKEYGLPVVIRPSFTLGGAGGGVAYSEKELETIVQQGLSLSPTSELLIEESAMGWKEYEFEVIRDCKDNAFIICSIENIDPMGVHTGDSWTVAPAQTLSDKEFQVLRNASLAVLRKIGVKTGGSNVQFAMRPEDGRIIVVEMNPRVSRSSALASKATGYPIAKVAAKVAIGYTLDEIENEITQKTKAAFEPSLDYVVVKAPRFAFEKFNGVKGNLTTRMQSVGEIMSIGRNFRESFFKAVQSLEYGVLGLEPNAMKKIASNLQTDIVSDKRLSMVERKPDWLWRFCDEVKSREELPEICKKYGLDTWFGEQLFSAKELETECQSVEFDSLSADFLWEVKQSGFSDKRLGDLFGVPESLVRLKRNELDVTPVYRRVDTCAGEFEAFTPYLYSTYEKPTFQISSSGIDKVINCEAAPSLNKKVLILGSGPIRIGQGIEFDYSCVQATKCLREAGIETIMLNCNPETVSTDFDCADRLYFEPLTFEHVMNVIELEKPFGVILQFGGQTPLKLAKKLAEQGVNILGTTPDSIDCAEDRERFSKLLDELELRQPPSAIARSEEEARQRAKELGYPLMLRPSYVLGGRAMEQVCDDKSLNHYLKEAVTTTESHPLLIDRFLDGALEIDLDLVSDGKEILIGGILEHIEEAGIHSGDSACVLPPHTLSESMIDELCSAAKSIAGRLEVIGLMNVQFAIKNGEVFLIEVNPRGSRTVPFISKATGVNLTKAATLAMLGIDFKTQGMEQPPLKARQFPYYAVKEAVMPFIKFPESDSLLGPEMRSTGEVMGIAKTFETAFSKSQKAVGMKLPKSGTIFISLADPDKGEIIFSVKKLARAGFKILATRGTHDFLKTQGIESEPINKVRQGSPHILEKIEENGVHLMFNTTLGPRSVYDSHLFRRKALEHNIPYYTTVEAATAAAQSILFESHDPSETVRSIQEAIAELRGLNQPSPI